VIEAPALVALDWQLPDRVRAFVTTRVGGYSLGPWSGFNLGTHVGDDPQAVAANRALLQAALARETGNAATNLQWLQQVHGTLVHTASLASPGIPEADAIYCCDAGLACGVLTADCLPVLFCSQDGSEIAVAHAGWRGLAAGVLEHTLAAFTTVPAEILCWLGPAIGPCHFEVGEDVRQAFLQQVGPHQHRAIAAAFSPTAVPDKLLADLYQLARLRLQTAGVKRISGEPDCTMCDSKRWYSYRREPVTGRFATLIMRTA
jgi:polyphenol oxidase